MEQQKYFIITAGPTGSGKTNLVKETLRELNIDERTEYTKLLIDDLVENDITYKRNIKTIIDNIVQQCQPMDDQYANGHFDDCEISKYTNPTSETFAAFSKAYTNARTEKTGCGTANTTKSCNNVLNNKIRSIKDTTPSIVVFETTGAYIPKWLLSEEFIPDGYKIIISYSLLSSNNLRKRISSRAYESVITFKGNNSKPAPRLINVSKLDDNIGKILNTLFDIYSECIEGYNAEICGTRKIDTLLLFDNNNRDYTKVFDSRNGSISNEDFKMIVNSALHRESGGGRRRTKKHNKKLLRKSRRRLVR